MDHSVESLPRHICQIAPNGLYVVYIRDEKEGTFITFYNQSKKH